MADRDYWIGVVSRSHVQLDVQGGFVQLGHGKRAPLAQLRASDGALHFYLTGIMVVPSRQSRGIGSQIVVALLAKLREVPYANTLVEALPLPGLESFYERFGLAAPRRYAPGLQLWLNETGD